MCENGGALRECFQVMGARRYGMDIRNGQSSAPNSIKTREYVGERVEKVHGREGRG